MSTQDEITLQCADATEEEQKRLTAVSGVCSLCGTVVPTGPAGGAGCKLGVIDPASGVAHGFCSWDCLVLWEVDRRLDDMGLADPEMAYREIVRPAAKRYYMDLIREHVENTVDVDYDRLLDDLEGSVIGFVHGYQDGFKVGLES